MKYKYEKEAKNYQDLASGRVLYNQKGATAFPVRLASEIFLRAKAYLEQKKVKEPISIYDPCCGGGYMLSILFFLHGNSISKIYASDIEEEMVDLARRNLSLLKLEGINKRINELQEDIEKFNKESHKKALKSAITLKETLDGMDSNPEIKCFLANALGDKPTIDKVCEAKEIIDKVDLVITDIPYGNIVEWNKSATDDKENIELFLNNMLNFLNERSIITIISDKKHKIEHKNYHRIKHCTIGKRRISFLEKN
ncbi:hypothetical protein [Natronospora cellulosivora (SeqCode)]